MGKEGRGEKVNSWGRGKGDRGGDAEVRLRMEKMVEKEKGVKERGKRMGEEHGEGGEVRAIKNKRAAAKGGLWGEGGGRAKNKRRVRN